MHISFIPEGIEEDELGLIYPDSQKGLTAELTNEEFPPSILGTQPFEVNVIDSDREAREIIRNGDPIKYILDAFHGIYVGDYILAISLIATIGCQMCLNTLGLHPGLAGESGKGKSYACRAMFHLLPDRYKKSGSYSSKSFFHMGMEPGTVTFLDDIEKLPDEWEPVSYKHLTLPTIYSV